jgi:hypothetical protein
MDTRKYITLFGVAEMLGRSEGAVRQMVWRKQLPHRKVAGRIVFLREEIEKLIEDAPGVRPEELEKVSA